MFGIEICYLPVAVLLVSKSIFSLISVHILFLLIGGKGLVKTKGRTHFRVFPFTFSQTKTGGYLINTTGDRLELT